MEQTPAMTTNPVLSVNENGCVLYSNEAGNTLLNEWSVKIGEKLPSNIVDLVQKVISGNSPEKIEVKVGNKIYLVIFSPLSDQKCINISGFDISDQKELEEKLREREKKYRNIIETSVEGIWIFNAVSETTYVNEKMAEMLGYNREEMIGRFIWDFAYEEDKSIFQVKLANRKRGIDEVYELKLIRKDESSLWVSISAKGFFDDVGKFEGSVGMFTDITDRKKVEEALRDSEERFRSAFDDSAVAMALVCPDARLMKVNDAFCRLLGFEKSELEGSTFIDFTYPDDIEPSILNHKAVIDREKSFFWLEKRYIRKDGRVIWCEVSSSPVFDSKGIPIYTVAHVQDITERKQAEEALRQSEARYRLLHDSLRDAFVQVSMDGRIIDFNEIYRQLLGYSSEELLTLTYKDLTPESWHVFEDSIVKEQIIPRGYSDIYEKEYRRKDGTVFPIELRTILSYDETGQPSSMWAIVRDITERKRADEALKKAHETLEEKVKERTSELEKAFNSLKESEERLAESQRIAHLGNYDNNLVSDKLYWSDELYRIFGLKPQEGMTFNKFLNYIHPDDKDYVRNSVIEAYNGNPYAINFRIVRPNGEEHIVHSEREVIFDEKNNPIRAKGTMQDVTEHKKAEEKIKRLANIFEYSNDGIGLITPEGIVLEWNKGEERIYGYNEEDVVGRHISIITPPHLKNEPMDYVELIKKTSTSYSYTTSRLRKDGKTIEVSITLSPVFDSNGKMTAISFITRDITEQKMYEERLRLSEEKYRNIVETANEGISLLDSEGIVTYVNKKLADMLKYSSEEMIGRPVWDFVATECVPINKSNIEKRRLGVTESYEIKLIRKDGSSIWVSINAKSIFDDDGKYIGSLSMHTDITKRKEAEEALAKIEIARKQEIHHRIKNNLQVISSLLDLQAEQFRDKECIKDSEVLEAFRESQDRVISMALIHEELHKGGEIDTLNFSHYIEELADNLLLTYGVGNKGISLDMDIEEDIFFDMDTAVPLGMIINELVSNSLKHAFSGRDKGEIRIKLCRGEGSDTSFILIVSDNGIGIPEGIVIEDLDSLGLQLVTTLVEQLDGELELKRNKRTEFVIRFAVSNQDSKQIVDMSN